MTTSNGGCWLTGISENVEVLFVKQWIRFHDDVFPRPLLDFRERHEFPALENLGHFRIDPDGNFLGLDQFGHFPDLLLYLITDRFGRTHPARSIAVGARRANDSLQRRLSTFPSNRHQTEIIKLKNLGRR